MSCRALLLSSVVCLASGCANVMPQQAGHMVGAIVGSAVAPGIGAPVGSLLGTLAGMVVQQEMNHIDEKRERKELGGQVKPGDAPGETGPEPAPPAGVPARVWVDEASTDGRVIAGHFESRPLL